MCSNLAEGLADGTMQLPPDNDPITIATNQVRGKPPCDDCRINGGLLRQVLTDLGEMRDVIFFHRGRNGELMGPFRAW